MKKFKILLSLITITITILLTSCGMVSNLYGDKYSDDWLSSNTE